MTIRATFILFIFQLTCSWISLPQGRPIHLNGYLPSTHQESWNPVVPIDLIPQRTQVCFLVSSVSPLSFEGSRSRPPRLVSVSKFMTNPNGIWTKKTAVGLGLGQFLALLVTSTGFLSSELARKGIDAPTSQSFLNYVLLLITYGSICLYERKPLKAKWYCYMFLGIVDVEANFLVVKAYQYTSLTSVMLLDCWSIPCVIFLTRVFLKTKYKCKKFVGVAVCVAGLAMVVFSDVHANDHAKGSNSVLGDLLVIAGSMLYAVSNVGEEFLVQSGNRVELMAMLGFFGAVVSACQISVFEREELRAIHWSVGAVLPFIGFSASMFVFYSSTPFLLKICGSTMFNLSLLTSDMWAVLIRIFAYHEKVDWIYFTSFASVVVGLLIYSWENIEEVRGNTLMDASDVDCVARPVEEARDATDIKGIVLVQESHLSPPQP